MNVPLEARLATINKHTCLSAFRLKLSLNLLLNLMPNLLLIFLLTTLLVVCLPNALANEKISSQKDSSTKPIRLYLNDIKWPPFFFPNLEQGQLGLGKELINTCISKQNYQQQFKNLPIKRTHLYMSTGELDISVYSYKKSREQFVIYGKEPLFITEYGFASKKADQLEINKLADVKRYTIGHLAGLAHTPELSEIIEDKKRLDQVSIGHDIDSMFGQMLAQPQRFQVMANSKETLLWRSKQLGIADAVTVHELTIKSKPYFVTVSRSSNNISDPQQFLDNMDMCIVELKQSGNYQKIAEKYGL